MHTAKEIANLLKCKEGTVGVYARNGLRLYGEYEFKAVDSKPLAKEMRRLSVEYEKVRTQLLNSRYDLSRIKIIPFENDVKTYGTQTSVCQIWLVAQFENDEKRMLN